MKIQIIGYAGSGKSTLARRLGDKLNIPVLHLDSVNFYGDWQERTLEQKTQIVSNFLAKNDSWVIDGNYSSVCPVRFEQSDITIYLNYNRFYCYKKVRERYLKYKGKSREDLPCTEKLDKTFKRWVLYKGRTKARQLKHLENLNKTSGKRVIIKNVRQLNKFLKDNNL